MEIKEINRKQILLQEPDFSDEYLREVLKIPQNYKIISKKIIENRTTDTTRTIKLSVTWEDINGEAYLKKLFCKIPVWGKEDNPFDKWSKHEIQFYQNIDPKAALPIVRCHDAYLFADGKEFLLLLDDISDDYCTAGNTDLNTIDIRLNIAESMAKFHSYYWNGANTGELKYLHGDTNKNLEEKRSFLTNSLEKFLPYASDFYNSELLDIYQFVLKDAIEYEKMVIDRIEHFNNISVIHGDSHVFNIMIPKEPSYKPLLVDFQFWRMGLSTVDIMNLTRVSFPWRNDPEKHLEILKHYYNALLAHGIKNYDWEECLYDYFLSVAYAVFGPVFNYADWGLGHEYWGQGVFDTTNNYKAVKKLIN